MPKLSVKGLFDGNKNFYIYANDDVIEIDCIDNTAVFEVEKNSKYRISIEEIPESNNHTVLKVIFFILTLPVQALFRMFFTDTEWFKNAQPFIAYTEPFYVDVRGNTSITFSLSGSKYDKLSKTYSSPRIQVDDKAVETRCYCNKYSIANSYFQWVKGIVSALIVLCAVMGIIAVSVYKAKPFGAALCASVALVFVLICIITCIVQYRKMKLLYKNLLRKN